MKHWPPGSSYMLISVFFFSVMNLMVKFLPHIPSHEIIWFRSLISLVITVIQIKALGLLWHGNNKKFLILRGIFGICSLTLFFATLQHIPMASAVTLQYLSPVFATIFAVIWLQEKIKPLQWGFIMISIIGLFLIRGFDERVSGIYVWMGVGSALFSGLAYLSINILKTTDHPLVVVLYFPLIGLPVMSIGCLLHWVPPSGIDWFLLLGVGISTQIAQVNMTKAMQAGQLSTITLLQYLGVGLAFMYGYLFFGETYRAIAWIGILMVVGGVILNVWYRHHFGLKNKI